VRWNRVDAEEMRPGGDWIQLEPSAGRQQVETGRYCSHCKELPEIEHGCQIGKPLTSQCNRHPSRTKDMDLSLSLAEQSHPEGVDASYATTQVSSLATL
jgi:hypothetical protein